MLVTTLGTAGKFPIAAIPSEFVGGAQAAHGFR
jgi:hypothetical protein